MTAGQRWRKEKPTVPGWYWLRREGFVPEVFQLVELPGPMAELQAVYIEDGHIERMLLSKMYPCEWCSPLTPPATMFSDAWRLVQDGGEHGDME